MKKSATLISWFGNRTLRNLGTTIKLSLMLLLLNVFVQNISAQVIKIDGLTRNGALDEWNQAGITHLTDPFNVVGADTIFAGNEKDFFFANDWHWKFGTAKDKNDIANGAAALLDFPNVLRADGTPAAGGPFLVFCGDRYSNKGDAQIGFWFFQDGTSPVTVDGVNLFAPPKHAPPVRGDILVLADFTGGGRDAAVTVLEWVGTGGTYPKSNGAFNQITTVTAAVAENNGGPQPVPGDNPATRWPFEAKGTGSTTTYETNEFYEGFIDLGEIFGDVPICFSRFMLETRSSQEITATLDDFLQGPLGGIPTAPTVADQQRCGPGTVTFTVTSSCNGSLKWFTTAGGTTPVFTGNPFSPNLTSTTDYWVSCTNSNGCEGPRTKVTGTVNPNPTPTVNNATICAGASAQLTATPGTSPASYKWSTGETTQSITKSPASTTTYNVTVTNSSTQCVGYASGTIYVNANPTPSVNNATICAGESGQLTATPGTSPASYKWSTGETTQSITKSPAGNTTYNVTVTNSTTGCVGYASGTIYVNANPTPSVNNATVCAGASAQLTATPGTSPASYKWSTGETTQSITKSPGANTTYNVTVTNSTTGCVGYASGTIYVNANPTPSVNNATICAGESAQLTATPGTTPASYKWSTGETTQSITKSPAGNTTYNVTVTNSTTGCVGYASGTIYVNANPTPSVNNATICAGGSAQLTATPGTSPASYKWSTGETTQSITKSPAGNTTYNVTVTNSTTGCMGYASGTIYVNPNLNPTVNNVTICSGSSGQLTAMPGTANPLYKWSTGETSQSITKSPTVNTTYNVTVTDGITSCTGYASGTIYVLPPVVTEAGPNLSICAGQNALITGASITGGTTSGTWSTSGTGTFSPNNTTVNNVTYIPSAADITAGVVTLTLTSQDPAGPCPATMDNMTLTIRPLSTADAGTATPQCRAAGTEINTFGVNTFNLVGTATNYSSVSWGQVVEAPCTQAYNITIIGGNSLTPQVKVGGNVNGGCVKMRLTVTNTYGCNTPTSDVILTMNALPTILVPTVTPYCANATDKGNLTIGPIESGVNYTLRKDGNPYNPPPYSGGDDPATQSGSAGSSLTWHNLVAGTYDVLAVVIATNCSGDSPDKTVIENSLPDPELTPIPDLCTTDPCATLVASPSGGVWTGTGVQAKQGGGYEFCPGVGVGTYELTYTYTTAEQCVIVKKMNVTVISCATQICTYTQGYFGNEGGTSCDGTTGGLTTKQLINQSLTNWQTWNGGSPLTIGYGSRIITIAPTAQQIQCVIDKLPGGGNSREINGTNTICTYSEDLNSQGRITNTLLAQTIALGLNIGITNPSDLGSFVLQAGCLYTAAPQGGCGSSTPKPRCVEGVLVNPWKSRCFSQALIDAIKAVNGGNATVSGLFLLANRALGNADGSPEPADVNQHKEQGISLSEIAGAAGAINEVFDECRIPMGWVAPAPCAPSSDRLLGELTSVDRINSDGTSNDAGLIQELKVSAFPNPFNDVVKFVIESPVSGQAELSVYNIAGQRVSTLYNGYMEANTRRTLDYRPGVTNTMLIYRFVVGDKQVAGKLIGIQ